MRELDLTDLVTRATNGDESAWRVLVIEATGLLFRVARAHHLGEADAWDICQSTWLSLAQQLPAVREPARLPGWLATTARRLALRTLARRGREVPWPRQEFPRADTAPSPEALALAAERDATLRRIVRELPVPYQRLLWLLAQQPELTYAQLAAQLGVAPGSVGPLRRRCLDVLRRQLRAEGIDHP